MLGDPVILHAIRYGGSMLKWAVGLIIFVVGPKGLADSQWDPGAYIVKAAGCADCHTVDINRPFAGGYAIRSPFGTFYSPNITPDDQTGIGGWSEPDFFHAIRDGVGHKKKILYPAFPYRSYTKLTDEDIHNIYVYIRSQRPIRQKNIPHNLSFLTSQRWLVSFWQNLFFQKPLDGLELDPFIDIMDLDDINIKIAKGPFKPDQDKSPEWNRGAYIVEAVAHCTECHTPRDAMGGLRLNMWMAGAVDSINKKIIPNITPDETGVGKWRAEDWLRFLRSGYLPDNSTIKDQDMAHVIANMSSLEPFDQVSIVKYMMALKPVRNQVQDPSNAERSE